MTTVIGTLSRWGLWGVLLVFVTLGIARGAGAAEDEDTKPPAATTAPPADWRTLTSGRFELAMRNLLYASSYDQLDAIIAEINAKQMKSVDGHAAVNLFFAGVSRPHKMDDPEDWKTVFQLLTKWKEHSDNLYTVNAIGRTQDRYGWYARTGAWAKDLTEEQVKIFASSEAQAEQTLRAALKMPGQCVDIYANLLSVGQAEGWPREIMDALLERAVAIAPDYYPCYRTMAYYTLERWYGQPGDTERFLASIPARCPGDRGYETLVRTAMQLLGYYPKGFLRTGGAGLVDWPSMRKGFESIERNYPAAHYEHNQYALCAYLARERPTVQRLIDELKSKKQRITAAWTNAGGIAAVEKWLADAPVSGKSDGDEPVNLLANGDFGKGLEGWSVQPFAGKGRAAADAGVKYETHPSLRVDNPALDNTYVSQKVPVKPNTRYRLSGWIKTKDVEDQHAKGDVGAVLSVGGTPQATASVVRANDWIYVEIDFSSATKSEIEAGARLGSWGGTASGTAWFADVSLMELGK